jgi:8-oxo-dGTP pyrophosphatase MutT (NUDIX family)
MKKEELLQVFDENKNMLDESIERSLKKTLTNGKHFMIILVFIENDGKFLIQKSSKEKGNDFATTGGHVTYNDDGFITCKKEVSEELGIHLEDDEIEYVDTIDYKNCFCEIYYSSKYINISELNLQEEEVESVNWFSKEEIENIIENNQFRKSNIEAFNKIMEYKKKHIK